MARPTSSHVARYDTANVASAPDGRLFSPTFDRNAPPLIAALAPWFAGGSGPVLEIGCGTGQHAGAFALAFPSLDWWPSDPFPEHRASARAWRAHLRLPDREILDLDATGDWPAAPGVRRLGPLAAVFAMNVVHIAPWAVAEGIVAGAGRALAPGGALILYGPFKVHGDFVGEGNRAFDAGLRADNPAWGLRDVAEIEALGRDAGLTFATLTAMPANNRLIVLQKTTALAN